MDEQIGQSFPKSKRLSEKYQFDSIFRNPDYRTSRGSVRAKFRVNDLNHPRLGLIIAKRQFPHAVARNAIKREIREGFRMVCERLPCVDIVVQVFSFKERAQFSRSLDGIWQDIMLTKGTSRYSNRDARLDV